MKKLKLIVALLIGASTATFAHDHMYRTNFVASDLWVVNTDGLKFRVTATNLTGKSVVEVKDFRGNVLHKEVITGEDFAKVFDLNTLPDGSYEIVLSNGDQKVSKSIEIATTVVRKANAK